MQDASSTMAYDSLTFDSMKAWRLHTIQDLTASEQPLRLEEVAVPVPTANQLLVKVICCGICHTDMDIVEGRLPPSLFPRVPGHQVIGIVAGCGKDAHRFREGERVGVAWINSTCGTCEYCRTGQENLCARFRATGKDEDGGYAEYMVVDEAYAYDIPAVFSDEEAAPLLCAGAIGYRSLKLAHIQDGQILGLTGFGASGHLVLQTARHLYPNSMILVFARSEEERSIARSLGASWEGDTQDQPPLKAHAMIDTTPAWAPVMSAMLQLRNGGRLVINAIRKEHSDVHVLSSMRYADHLWMEKEIKSVANITRQDVSEFLTLAAAIPIRPLTEVYPFGQANEALIALRTKPVLCARVLRCA